MRVSPELPNPDDGRDDEIDAGDFSGPFEWYWHFSQRGDFETDAEQLKVLRELQRLFEQLEDYRQYRQGKLNRLVTNLGAGRKPPRGIYIWGGVGRGKSLMMDAFFKVSRHRRKRRVHFHEFMREIHARMRALSGQEDPLEIIASEIARELRLLAFDEFHVSDIADAMILARLLELLIVKGVVLVMTSNYKPDDLYPNGLQRARFLPAITLLQRHCHVLEIASPHDWRLRALTRAPVYLTPPGAQAERALAMLFDNLARGAVQEGGVLEINDRAIPVRRACAQAAWFDFDALCEGPRGSADYIELARAYPAILISEVPQFTPLREDAARRFMQLVDELYDRRVKLALSAAVPAVELYDGTRLRAAFARTASRLIEMQSAAYLAEAHR